MDSKLFIQTLKNLLSSQKQVDSNDNYTSLERSILENLKKFSSKNLVGVAVSNSMLCAAPKQLK
jgi:hypothetical protein